MFYNLHCSVVKKLLPVPKNQNGVLIQDGVENVLVYHPIFSKMIFLFVFLWFFFNILGKNKNFMEIFFLENSKWRNNLI
jgi:hypothetical protein